MYLSYDSADSIQYHGVECQQSDSIVEISFWGKTLGRVLSGSSSSSGYGNVTRRVPGPKSNESSNVDANRRK